jgi:hypothetical protein
MTIKPAPDKGLTPQEALARWSDPDAFAKMKELEDARDTIVMTPEGQKRHWDFVKWRDVVEAVVMEQIRSGKVLVSAVEEGDEDRRIIPLSIWPLLTVDFEYELVIGETRRYELPEFFEPSEIPANVFEIPKWLKTLPGFREPTAPGSRDRSSGIPIVLAVQGQQVLFNGGITVNAERTTLLSALLPPFRQALDEGRDPEDFESIDANTLANALGIAEQSLRQLVSRTRRHLAHEFEERFGLILDRDAIVENTRSDGYRLNPRIILAKPFQVINLS